MDTALDSYMLFVGSNDIDHATFQVQQIGQHFHVSPSTLSVITGHLIFILTSHNDAN